MNTEVFITVAKLTRKTLVGVLLLVVGVGAKAIPATARSGLSLSTGLMALTNSTKQGGNGSQGSTLLTESNFMWQDGWYGAGGFFQYDKQGTSEVDTAAGPRLELIYDPFFFAFEYSLMMTRAFTDRAVAQQKGSGFSFEAGARFGVNGGNDNAGLFLFGAYNYRVQTVSKQDGVALDDKITQIDGYPLFGLGIGF